ncbi:hypothetical protein [Facklamia sp. 7083-14-GEN3]|uniref:hypothetical protein n=1 Tax=Facklamia sp. 7083-14-GEN3 TaxID=2973478 RepID=UPI00215D4D9B|nr:hypothetical protein [Facklamia sp. 7083-14-GEN3]MCR8969298.1 hypothetical protein [Facklamia sp. 7083-14-GEN3]
MELTQLNKQDLAIVTEFYELERQIKLAKERQSLLRADLVDIMEDYNVKKWENEYFNITYVEPTTRESIDSTKLKKELPDVAEKYKKVSNVKASVRVKIK